MTVESTGIPVGEKKFSIGMARSTSGRYKATVRLVVPIVQDEIVNGISRPTVVRTAYVDATFSFDSSSTEQERKDTVGMFQSAFDPSKALVNDTIVKLQGVY